MLIKLAALGGLGYAAYRYFGSQRTGGSGSTSSAAPERISVAGGPLSDRASIQHSPDEPPTGERPQL